MLEAIHLLLMLLGYISGIGALASMGGIYVSVGRFFFTLLRFLPFGKDYTKLEADNFWLKVLKYSLASFVCFLLLAYTFFGLAKLFYVPPVSSSSSTPSDSSNR